MKPHFLAAIKGYLARIFSRNNSPSAQQTADPYGLNYNELESRIFLSKSREEKEALFEKTSFITSLPPGTVYDASSRALNETVIANARKKKAQIVVASVRQSARYQKERAAATGLKVCYGGVDTIQEVMIALLMESDHILVNKALDMEKVKALLLEDHKEKVIPYDREIDLTNPGEALFNRESVAERTPGSNLRILSFNILATVWNHRPQVPPRAGEIIKFIREISPDAIGLQEVDEKWMKALKNSLSPYKFVSVKTVSPKITVMGNLLYNSAKYREITGGHLPYFSRKDPQIWCFYWVMLEELTTGKRFIIANTHWALTIPLRLQIAEKMSGFIKELEKKYHLPVICTGDYNSNMESRELQLFLEKSDMLDAVSTAHCTENKDLASSFYIKYFSAPFRGEKKHIDHVIATRDLTPLSARLVLDKKLLNSSDHLPLVVDYKF